LNISFESLLSFGIGIAIGLVLAIPVGPTAILCMRRTLDRGPLYGFATGVGASLADAFYGAAAAFGVSAISGFLKDHDIIVRLAGGIFMIVMATRVIRHHVAVKKTDDNTSGHAIGALISGFLLTVTNPMTMFGFVTVFTSLHWVDVVKTDYAWPLIVGVALGSALWWLALTLGITRLKHRLNDGALHRINLLAGCLLGLFGVFTLAVVLVKILHHM
jgi:threonine/homoserine/homoserine lactone efflux protein